MSDFLQKQLGITQKDKVRSAKTIGKVKSVATFFADAVKAVKDSSLVDAIADATPWWVSTGGKVFAESVPMVKFAVDLFSEWTKEHDPHALGLLACTLAYQKSVEDVFNLYCSEETAKNNAKDVERRVADVEFDAPVDFKSFSFYGALAHPFYTKATAQFEAFASGIGYGENHIRIFTGHIGRAFVRNLKTLLANGKLREKFRPFTDLMMLSTDEAAYDVLLAHLEATRRKFEEEGVFGKEPFALSHVYIGTECGTLKWGDTRSEAAKTSAVPKKELVDPFKEKFGGRCDLLQEVINLMADPQLREPIVIQGVAGSGKSSFTLKLATELGRLGFVPLRIRLKDLRLDVHVSEAIPQALFPKEQEMPEFARSASTSLDGSFIKRVASTEEVELQGVNKSAKISRYVLILDGWDEISISASEGFRIRVTRVLEQVYGEYLSTSGVKIRVIFTGRPSIDVEQEWHSVKGMLR